MSKVAGADFIDALVEESLTHFAGVPCSSFSGLFNAPELCYFPAPHEGLAYAWAVGGYLAGRPTGVITQNSGVGNLMNALTSLALPCEVPVFSLVSLRGYPTPESDEDQHVVMGQATEALIRETGALVQMMEAERYREQLSELIHATVKTPRFLLIPKGMLEWDKTSFSHPENEHSELSALGAVQVLAKERRRGTPTFATTGYTSRYLASTGDVPYNFYMQGSMGHVPALAAGFAAASGRATLIIDGDGALAMHPGAMSLLSDSKIDAVHVVIVNGSYASTGGQTLPAMPRWRDLAHAYGYDRCLEVNSAFELAESYSSASTAGGVSLVIVRVNDVVCSDVPRASNFIKMNEMFSRFHEEMTC